MKNQQIEEEIVFLKKVLEIEDIINNILDNTNPLCYKTIHTPEIEVNDELREMINMAKKQLDSMGVKNQ